MQNKCLYFERVIHMKRRSVYNRKKNRKLSMKRIPTVIATFAFVLTILFSVNLVANAKEEQTLYKYYESYMVEKDDTLYSISRKMNEDNCSDKLIKECVEEMISINSLDHKGTICYGNYIIVPYYSTEYR